MTAIIRIILIVDFSYTNCPFKKCQELRELEEYAMVGEEFISIVHEEDIKYYPLIHYDCVPPPLSLSDIRCLIVWTFFCSFICLLDTCFRKQTRIPTELPIITQLFWQRLFQLPGTDDVRSANIYKVLQNTMCVSYLNIIIIRVFYSYLDIVVYVYMSVRGGGGGGGGVLINILCKHILVGFIDTSLIMDSILI